MTADFPAVPTEAITARLPFEVASVTTARELVSDRLTQVGVPQRVVEDANLVIGELVMNGVRHGEPQDDGTVVVSYWFPATDVLRFSVADGGRVDRLEARMPGPDEFGGRGLAIVDRLCRSWTYDTGEGSTRVTADIPLA